MAGAVLFLASCLQPEIGFQGRLADSSGNPVANGTYTMTVRFWTHANAGTNVFTQTKQVTVQDGLFSTDISDFPPHIFSSEVDAVEGHLYMEVTINNEKLSPRRPIYGAPFAHALVAGSGVVGARYDAAHITDGGYDAVLTVINTLPAQAGYGVKAQSSNAALYADNVKGDGSGAGPSSLAQNPDIIVGGYYYNTGTGDLVVEGNGLGVIASEPSLDNSSLHLRSSEDIRLYKRWDTSGQSGEFMIYNDGQTNVQARLDSSGNWSVDGTLTSGGADYAELIDVEGAATDYEPGDVLVISDQVDRAVELAAEAYSSRVVGVYSTDPAFVAGAGTPEEQIAREEQALARAGRPATLLAVNDGAIEVAIAGIVPVKVSAENGPIRRGDLLTTSNTPGHAMKATQLVPGTILGKAMGTLDSGTGVIEVLVLLQ
jgi:hypothetical protein